MSNEFPTHADLEVREEKRIRLFIICFILFVVGVVILGIYFRPKPMPYVVCSSVSYLTISGNYALALDQDNKLCSYNFFTHQWAVLEVTTSTTK